MTTVQTRVREISNKEGFDITATGKTGRNLILTKNGVLKKPWPRRNKTRGTHTVQDFRDKFSGVHPGYSCHVLKGDGSKAHGNMLLKQVRATY